MIVPFVNDEHHYMDETPFYAGDLLGMAKTSVRNDALATFTFGSRRSTEQCPLWSQVLLGINSNPIG